MYVQGVAPPRVLLASAFVVATASAACSLLFQISEPGSSPSDAGSGDTAAPQPDAADAGCPLARWPGRPESSDPSQGNVDLTFGLQSLNLGFGDAGPAPGFDLDESCTCPGPPSCVGPGQVPCDRDGGIDNGESDLLRSLSAYTANVVDEAQANRYIRLGRTGLLFVLHEYNGQPNDAVCELSLFVSDGTPLSDAGFHVAPRFDGNDAWLINGASVAGGALLLPRFVDSRAYVKDGVLVAHVDFPLVVAGKVNLTVDVKSGVIVARLTNDAGLWRLLDGVIAGRWSTGSLLTALAAFDDPVVPGGHLCGDSVVYQRIKPVICRDVDIMAAAAADGKGARCDALSVGIGFIATQAKLGPIGPEVDAGAPCGRDYKDECPN